MVHFRRNPDEGEAAVEPEADAATGDRSDPDGEQLPAFSSFGEEVQSILVSAHDAAAKILRRAEEEAEQIRTEAAAAADASRTDADRLRSEAESYAQETRTAADDAAEERRGQVEAEAGRILEDAERRREAIDADLEEKLEHAEEDARQRSGALQDEIQRQEERLEKILLVLQSMTSDITALLDRKEGSDNFSADLANLTDKAVEEAEGVRFES